MKPQKNAREQMFGPLADLTSETVANQVAARRFDFGQDSAISRHLVQRTFAAIEDDERRQGILRVPPFTLRLEVAGSALPIALLDHDMTTRLIAGEPLGQIMRNRREAVFKELLRSNPAASMDQVRRLLAPTDLLAMGKHCARSMTVETTRAPSDPQACRMDLAQLRKMLAVPNTLLPSPEMLPSPPAPVMAKVGLAIEQEGRSPEMARSFVSHMVDIRQRYCVRFDDLAPGQLVAIALDVSDRRMSTKTRYRAHVPVRLTLYTEAEIAALEQLGPWDRQRVDDILERRIARMLTEAYCQGGLLTHILVGILTHQSTGRVSYLVDHFEATHGLVLPTPGTIHDAGSKLTHKAAIVRLHLTGMECKEIARETFHSEEAVGRYVDDFERVLIASAHSIAAPLLARVLRLGPHVVTQYESLIAQHIGGLDDVRAILKRRGVNIEVEQPA